MKLSKKITPCGISFSGRLTRAQFIGGEKAVGCVIVLLVLVAGAVALMTGFTWGVILATAVMVPIGAWAFSLQVRRLHDVGLSGGWVLVPCLAPLGALLLMALLFNIPLLQIPEPDERALATWLIVASIATVLLTFGYLLSDVFLHGWLNRDGDATENEYGDPPGPRQAAATEPVVG